MPSPSPPREPFALAGVNLNRLAVFAAVIEAGSFSAAARRLSLAKAMVSTHVRRLEAEVGASLLVRTTRSLTLTDAGAAFHAATLRVLREASDAVAAARQDSTQPRGTLRVTAPVDYAAAVVAPIAAALARRHPALNVDMVASDQVLDLVAEGIDVAIRIGRGLADSSHRALRVGRFDHWLVASPTLVRQGRPPRTLDEAAVLPLVGLTVLPRPFAWTFQGRGGEKRTVRFAAAMSANTGIGVRACALAGAGLAVLPDFAVSEDVAQGRLLRLLPGWHLPDGGIHALFPAARQTPQKIRVFLDALKGSAAIVAP